MYSFPRISLFSFNFLKHSRRRYSLIHKLKEKQHCSHWQSVVNEAERILGDKCFRNINWLISDEVSDLVHHIQTIKNTQHPVAHVVSDFAYTDSITWGLVVMLFSKAAGKYMQQINSSNNCVTDDIIENQYTVAKVTQMLSMTITVHKAVCNNYPVNNVQNYGNKVAVLCGDYFLGKCLLELATLQDQYILEIMSSALRDLTNGQYLGPRDKDNRPYPCKPNKIQEDISHLNSFSTEPIETGNAMGNSQAEWILRNTLGGCSLLGKACSSVLRLAGYSEQYQNIGYSFGKCFGLAYNAFDEIKSVYSDSFGVTSLPVLLYIRNDEKLFDKILKSKDNIEKVDYDLIRRKILSSEVVGEANAIKKKFADAASESLDIFGPCDAQILLRDIIKYLL